MSWEPGFRGLKTTGQCTLGKRFRVKLELLGQYGFRVVLSHVFQGSRSIAFVGPPPHYLPLFASGENDIKETSLPQ